MLPQQIDSVHFNNVVLAFIKELLLKILILCTDIYIE